MRAIFVQFTPLGVLLKGKSKLRKRKRWVVVPFGSNFSEFKLPRNRKQSSKNVAPYLWQCSTVCDMVHEETHTKLFNHKKLAATFFSFVCTGCVGRIVDFLEQLTYFQTQNKEDDCWSQRALERKKYLWRNRFYSEANDGEQYIVSVKCQIFIAEHFSNCSFTACQLSRKMKCIYVLLFQQAFVRNHEEK